MTVSTSVSEHHDRRGAFLLLGAIVLLWGINWPIMKVGLSSIPPFWFGGLRLLLGSASLFLLLGARGQLALPARGDWPLIASVGLLQMAGFLALVNTGLLHVPAGRSAVLCYTTPLWVAPGAALLLGEKLSGRKLAGLALGLVGLLVLFQPGSFDWSDRPALLGNAYLLGGALLWSFTILHIRGRRWQGSALALAPWQLLVGAVPLLAVAALTEGGPAVIDWNPGSLLVLAYNGPVASAFCYWAAVVVTRRLPALTASLAFLTVPAMGLASSALALGERPDASLLGGFVLILIGLVLVETRRKQPA
ncbi:membrane protein [Hypericibacter adhaerens]|uniref:Membrane protein n=1 Tax=Hypericibacter adhaerens TaxID=2602016 RepID=A0A5J6N3G8_9PROT|nr:DMT family transporter [Hypericibacter adhaerens]QEX24329.1 membrane protein [Hypericibacter adhaerens]